MWGNASLQQFGDVVPYVSAAALLVVTLVMTLGLHLGDSGAADRVNTVARG